MASNQLRKWLSLPNSRSMMHELSLFFFGYLVGSEFGKDEDILSDLEKLNEESRKYKKSIIDALDEDYRNSKCF